MLTEEPQGYCLIRLPTHSMISGAMPRAKKQQPELDDAASTSRLTQTEPIANLDTLTKDEILNALSLPYNFFRATIRKYKY